MPSVQYLVPLLKVIAKSHFRFLKRQLPIFVHMIKLVKYGLKNSLKHSKLEKYSLTSCGYVSTDIIEL